MNPLEKVTDLLIAVLAMFVGTVLVFGALFRSAGLLVCERQSHILVDRIEASRVLYEADYKQYIREINSLPGKTGIKIYCETEDGRCLSAAALEAEMADKGGYWINEGEAIIIEILYNRLPLYFCALG